MKKSTVMHYSTQQGLLPLFISEQLDILDSVLVFDEIMNEIEIEKYLKPEASTPFGRPSYNRLRMLKTILFGFMDTGIVSLRELADRCKVNLRYMYLMDYDTPSYRSFGYFINNELMDKIEQIFQAVMLYIKEKDNVDMQHLYIDGTKLEANANKYTWVWKKGTERSRYRLFEKITRLLDKINESVASLNLHIDTTVEYTPEYLKEIASRYASVASIEKSKFVCGRGCRKKQEQRFYETLVQYTKKLEEYTEKLKICGPKRNSYSKTDHDATFMRMHRDYMGNDQLLPGYNIQIGVADEYIAVIEVLQDRSDMDCFVPVVDMFYKLYGLYPKYPVADAGYGSYNNYIYCDNHGMEKYMKFPMYNKETTDAKYRNNPFRAINFKTDSDGNLICPNNKKFHLAYRQPVKGNLYGRKEEVYVCEDCSGCPYAQECKKTDKNRTVNLNRELTAMHEEVINNLESIHGALLRKNRAIQAEGTFGILKYDRWYRRLVRRGRDPARLEVFLVAIGHNLYKYHNKKKKMLAAA